MIKQRKKIAAMLVASMIFVTSLPNTAEAFKINWGTDPRVEQSWTDFAKNEAGKYKLHYTNMGLNEAWHDITKGWPLGAQMFLQVRPGTDSDKTGGNDEIAKKFDGHQLYCTGNHEEAVSIQPGSRAFMSEDYNLDPKNPNRFSIKNPNYNFNFLMLSIASALPMDGGTVPADTEYAFEDPYAPMGAVVQAIDWIITDHDGFEGANAALGQSDEDVRAAFIKDLNTFMTEGGYYSDLLNFDHPYIRSYVTAPPVAGSLGASLGLQNKAQSIFADVWYSAYLTCGMDPDWTKEFTSYKHPVEQENGEYVMELQFPSDPAISSYILGLTFSPYGDWKQVATSKANTLRFTSVTGECDENSSIGTLKYDSNKVGAMMPIDLTKAHMRTFDTYQPGKGFGYTQTQFGAYVENGLEIRVINGHSDNGGGGGKVDGQVVRYKHNEDWQATYNVNLFKFDSETGKPIEGSKWDILEKFDASQLDNTDLDRTKDAPGSYTSTAGSLNSTEWGDDTIEDNFSGDTGVNTSDANKYNWANDSGTQFETWDDPHDDPCKRDKNVTGADGKLYEISSNGENSGDEAHSDLKKYTYTKGYCSGHPEPVIEYQELTGDPEEDAQIEEENQELHDAAWQAWYEEVETCEKLVEEGGFFHAIDPGAAKEALEEDRDQFYKDFTSLTYEYSAEETRARTGYILHGLHTDDIPVEWRTVTSSQYKDWTSRGALNHAGANDAGGDDEAEGIDGYALDTASVIDDNVENEEKYVDTIPVSAKDEKTTEAYEKAVDEYVENTASENNKETNEETAANEETVSSEDSEKKKVDKAEVNETEVNETAADACMERIKSQKEAERI